MDECPESLEKIFQKLEEESERRAEEEHLTAQRVRNSEPHGDSMVTPNDFLSVKKAKERRRGSISISRLGQFTVDDFASKSHTPTTPTMPTIAAKSSFYQSQIANDSTTSVASGASAFSNDHAHAEDDNHVTQMHHIVGKQSISSKMLPRRLSRSQSAGVIPTRSTHNLEPSVIIGVFIQEATVESPPGPEEVEDGTVTISRRTSVMAQAPRTLRHQSSRSTMPSLKLSSSSWIAKAKNFTQKFKRKSKSPLLGLPSYS